MTSISILDQFGATLAHSKGRTWSPTRIRRDYPQGIGGREMPINVYDDGEAFRIDVFVPGVVKADINVTVEKSLINIMCKRDEGDAKSKSTTLLTESHRGHLSRGIRMPNAINVEKAESRLENGILTITLPKLEADQPRKLQVLG
ncbi:MAG: Hsp20/alpha crystallin family protein [Chloroflexota bacterium]|nr:Hsp20/alpha crystallin family protein [Chloroflexota bacterium]